MSLDNLSTSVCVGPDALVDTTVSETPPEFGETISCVPPYVGVMVDCGFVSGPTPRPHSIHPSPAYF